MRKNRIKNVVKISSLVAISLGIISGVKLFSKASIEESDAWFSPNTTYTIESPAVYYQNIGSKTGDTLLSSLRSLNSSKRRTTISYSTMGADTNGQGKISQSAYVYTDYDPSTVTYDNKGQPYGTKLISFYSGNSTLVWNREHVWPDSKGGGSVQEDIHMPRPTIPSENSSRGNSFYVEGMKHSANGWDPAMESFGKESYRGDSARIIFYCMVLNSNLNLVDTATSSSSSTMGKLSDLLKWNANYPVQQREKNRNEGAQYLQGNRNPFIDHPEYACKIWGNYNTATRQICDNAVFPDSAPELDIYDTDGYTTTKIVSEKYVIKVGDSVNFLGYADGVQDSSVSWSLSDYNVATSAFYTNNGVTVTGVSAGEITLTLTKTYTDQSGDTQSTNATLTLIVNNEGPTGPYTQGSGGGEDTPPDPVQDGDYAKITSLSQLQAGDKVVLATALNGKGVTGWNGNKDATVSSTQSQWMKYLVEKSGTNYCLKDESANKYIIGVSENSFKYGDTRSAITISSDGKFGIGNRILYENGTNYRMYTTSSSYNPFYVYKYSPSAELTSISISGTPSINQYYDGQSFDPSGLTVTAHYDEGDDQVVTNKVTWSPSTLTTSTTQVTASYTENNITKTATFSGFSVINDYIDHIVVDNPKTQYTVGDSFVTPSKVTAFYASGSQQIVTSSTTYSGYNLSITGSQTVTATCTACSPAITTTYQINVAEPAAATVSLNKTSLSLMTGTSQTLVATPTGSGTLSWSSSNSDVATVSNGTVTGVSVGTATITVTYGGASASCNITVSAASSTGTYQKVASNLPDWSGTYLLVYEYNATTAYCWTGVDAANCYSIATISSNTISEKPDTAVTLTIASYSTGYSIKVNGGTNDGKYIGRASDSNGISIETSEKVNTFSYNSSTVLITSNKTVMRFNESSDQSRFRYFKSTTYTSQKAVQLYKFIPSSSSSDSLDDAIEWAEGFTTNLTCNGGSTKPSKSVWSSQSSSYASLSSDAKEYFVDATYTLDGSVVTPLGDTVQEVAEAVARYEYIINKYGTADYPNFMNRSVNERPLNSINIFNKDNNSLILLVVISLLGISAVGIWFFVRKKHYEN